MTVPPTVPLKFRSHRFILDRLVVMASIGIYPKELANRQTLWVDVSLELCPEFEVTQDTISHTLDYDFIKEAVTGLIAERHFNLQETLVREIATLCFQPEIVKSAKIRLTKPDVYDGLGTISYEAEIERSDNSIHHEQPQ